MDGTKRLIIVFLSLLSLHAVGAQESAYQASTTADPDIGTSDLELLLKPLRMNELVIETEAWLSLLQAKVRQISLAEIKMREKGREISDKKEDLQNQIQEIQAKEKADTSSGLPEAGDMGGEHEIKKVLEEKAELTTSGAEDIAQMVAAEVSAADSAERSSEKR